jgi:hypothetical protein
MIIGGPRSWKIRRHGDLGVSFQWVNNEPAMILFRPALSGSPGVAICLSAAHRYCDSKTGAPTPYLAEKSVEYAAAMGFAGWGSARKIANVIADSLPDLVNMPPEPDWSKIKKAPAFGDIQLREDGKVVAEMPLRMQ